MQFHRKEWCRSAVTAVLTVTFSVVALGQGQNRIGNTNTDFDDVNRLIRDGADRVPGFGTPGGTSATTTVDFSRIDRRAVQNLLTESIDESERLYRLLQTDYQRSPEVRPYMTDLLSVRARAARIAQDMQANVGLERLHPQFQQLDSDWRLLSHQMAQSRRLSTASQDGVARIDRLGRSLEKLFKMEPQLDRNALIRELATLSSSVRNLGQELELDPNAGNSIYQLVLDARKLDQQAARVQSMVLDQYPYTQIVSEYLRFEQMWKIMAPKLRSLNNRFVERSARNVTLADSRLHDLLWLEQQTNNDNLRQTADALMRDVDEFYSRVPLKLLLHFKGIDRILETADNFYGTVQNFRDCVDRNEDERTVLECYRYVEEYGNIFVRDFAALRSQAGRVVLREIEDGIVALRNELNLAGTVTSVDTREMLPTAASLENLADHLDYDVQQWLYRDRQSFRDQALQASARFLARTQRIHRMLESRPTASELKKETADLIEEWKTIYQFLGRCNTQHRDHLRVLSQDISQAIYELRAPLQL
ncbi:MAG: hypothetical protein RIK87_08970 [Fuerstiella sp.]